MLSYLLDDLLRLVRKHPLESGAVSLDRYSVGYSCTSMLFGAKMAEAGHLPSGEAVMTSLTDTDFVPMRLGKVVAVSTEDRTSFCVVLEGVADGTRLPISIGETEGLYLSATLTGVQFGRPMSPQFAAELLRALGGRVRQVRIDRLVDVRGGTAYGSTVEVEGPSGVALVDARPSDALNLVALVPRPSWSPARCWPTRMPGSRVILPTHSFSGVLWRPSRPPFTGNHQIR